MAAGDTKKDSRSREQLLAEIDRLKANTLIHEVGSIARTFIRFGTIAFCAYMAKEALVALAGKVTTANILVEFLSSISVNVAIAWTLAVFGVGYGVLERRMRKRAVRHLAERKAALELRLDPKRSTSGLTRTGDTSPEDEKP